jgi:hypothetical protein
MAHDPESVAQLNQLVAELESTEWRASVAPTATANIVCLRIERPSPTPGAGTQAMELCRRSLAHAVQSARIHIFKSQ